MSVAKSVGGFFLFEKIMGAGRDFFKEDQVVFSQQKIMVVCLALLIRPFFIC